MKTLQVCAMTGILLLAACGQEETVDPISGSDGCRHFDEASVRESAERGDLIAIRGMRDYYFDCVIHNNGEQSLFWGRLAAEKGGEEDRRYYEGLKMTFGSK